MAKAAETKAADKQPAEKKPTTKSIVVRLKDQNHPSGKRNRAGFSFSASPTRVEVNKEQYLLIKNDPFLIITTKEPDLAAATEGEETKQPTEASGDGTSAPAKETEKERAGKDDIIKQLEAKGLKEGEDFEKDATRDDLQALLDS